MTVDWLLCIASFVISYCVLSVVMWLFGSTVAVLVAATLASLAVILLFG